MKHLSPAELVDLLDEVLDSERAVHVDRCEACAASARELRATMRSAALDGEVPEPSPLFWDHLSTRVRDAVAAEADTRGAFADWTGWRAHGVAPIAATLMVAVVVLSMTLVRHEPGLPSVTPSALPAIASEPVSETTIDASTAEVWEVLTSAAADLEWEAAHDAGMGVQPSTVDRAVQRLNPDELHELGRLLQSELKRPGN